MQTAKGTRKEVIEVVPPLTKKPTLPRPGLEKPVRKGATEEVKAKRP